MAQGTGLEIPQPDIAEWAKWVRLQADSLDPVKNGSIGLSTVQFALEDVTPIHAVIGTNPRSGLGRTAHPALRSAADGSGDTTDELQ